MSACAGEVGKQSRLRHHQGRPAAGASNCDQFEGGNAVLLSLQADMEAVQQSAPETKQVSITATHNWNRVVDRTHGKCLPT